MAVTIDGKQIAEDVVSKVKASAAELIEVTGITPGIAVVIVGEDPASQVYVATQGQGMRLPFRAAHPAGTDERR